MQTCRRFSEDITRARRHGAFERARVLVDRGMYMLGGEPVHDRYDCNGKPKVFSSAEFYNPKTDSWFPGPAVGFHEFQEVMVGTTSAVAHGRPDGTVQLVQNTYSGELHWKVLNQAEERWADRQLPVSFTMCTSSLSREQAVLGDSVYVIQLGELIRVNLLTLTHSSCGYPDERPNFGAPAIAAVPQGCYLFGGSTISEYSCTESPEPMNAVQAWDSVTKEWSLKSPMNAHRAYASAAVLDRKIYVTGGRTTRGDDFLTKPDLRSVEIYDVEEDTWKPGPPMIHKHAKHTALALYGKVFVFDGAFGEVLDPAVGRWCEIAQPETQRRNALFVCV
eukprot:TRINITY_DN7727_c0_g1_i2.p1 TRINITY_DN7727_c0_g1~~TRINITY_DN7727_c0_g1_i2.p1  ORF type:complete len:334 (-),score=67.58 TRINITY_DN7727_c0_g1_i2:183-1184(-)